MSRYVQYKAVEVFGRPHQLLSNRRSVRALSNFVSTDDHCFSLKRVVKILCDPEEVLPSLL